MTRRRLLAFLALALLALAGLFAFGLFPHAPLKRALESRLAAAIGGTVRIGSLRVVPALLSAEAEDIAIDSPTLRGRVAAARVEATAETLQGDLSLRSLNLSGVDLEVRPAPSPTPAPTAPPPVRIDRLDVSGATIRYVDPALGGDVLLSGVLARGSVGRGVLDLTLGSVRWERRPGAIAGTARARLEIAPDFGARLVRAEASVGASRLEASGKLGVLTAPAPDIRFSGEVDAAEIARLGETGPAKGRLRVAGRVLGSAPVTWEVKAGARSLEAAGLSMVDLEVQASGTAFDASAMASLGLMGGRVSIQGQKRGESVDLRVEAEKLQASGVPVSARFEARGAVAAEAVNLSWALHGEAQPALAIESGGRVDAATLEASGTIAGSGSPSVAGRAAGALHVVVADGSERSLRFEGAFRGRGETAEEITLRVPDADLAGLAPSLAGVAEMTATARGPLQRLSGSVRLDGRDLEYRGITLGTLDMEGDSRAGDWTLAARLPEHALTLNARSPSPGRGARRAAGALTFGGTSLAALAPVLPASAPHDGQLEGRVEFEGEAMRPAAVMCRSDVTLRGEHYSLRVEGGFGAAPTALLDLHVTGSADLGAFDSSETVDVAGTLQTDLRLRGTRLAPDVEGQARLLGVRVSGAGLPDASIDEARLELARGGVELKPAALALAGGSLTASGRYPFDASAPAEVHLEWSGLLAEKLLPARQPGSEATPLNGRLSGKADFTGRGAQLAAWRGEATLTAEAVQVGDMPLDLTSLRLRLEGGLLSAEPVILTSGPGSLTVGGRIDLANDMVDVRGQGTVDLRALSPLVGTASLAGVAEMDMAVGGRLGAPEPRGSIALKDASIRTRDIPEALTKIQGRVVLDGSVLRVEDMSCALGGGNVTASGEARLRAASLETARIEIEGRDLNLRYPVGLKSRLDADLALVGSPEGLVLRGDVRVQRGLYDLDLALGDAVKAPVVEPGASPMLRAIGLDVRVVLVNPVLIRNRLATLDVSGNLQFRGDLETPAPFGRMDLQGGGKVYLRGRGFTLDEGGGLSYGGDWDPQIKIRASLRIPDQANQTEPECSVTLDGRLSTAQPTLGCEGLSQGQALALVATGSSSGGAGGLGAQVASEQAASLALSHLSQGLGFEEVAVQPELLARDTEPGARFTFGKQLTRMLSLIYSISLKGPEQRFVQLEARLPRGVSLKGQRTDDGFFAAGVGQRIRLGRARKASASDDRVRLKDVRFEGEMPDAARSAARSKKGKRVAAWDIQDDADRVRKALVESGYVEAEVSGRLEGDVAVLRVQTGPRFAWRVAGMEAPPDLREAFRKALYEEDAVERAREQLVATLRERGFLRGRVAAVRAEPRDGGRTLVFEVQPGPRLEADVAFPGAHSLPSRRLLSAAGGPGALLTEGQAALTKIEDAYRREGRLGARAGPVQAEEAGDRVHISVPVDEGEPPRISAITFAGTSLPEEELRLASGLETGRAFRQEALAQALDKVRKHYYERGYAQVGVSVENAIRGSDVEVRFRVREGTATVVGALEIVGLRRMRESIVRRHIRLRPGEPVDPRRLAEVERRLLELGVFASVLVAASPENPATITIEVVEKDRIELAYDLRWSEDENTTVQLDAEVRNLAGIGLDLGGRYRYGADDREKRASLKVPSILRGKLTVSAFETQEDEQLIGTFGDVVVSTLTERVLDFQHSQRVKRFTTVLAGYRFKSTFTTDFPDPQHIATLSASGIRETRDNPLDARRGHFAALNLEFSPKAVGSDFTFAKGFGQLFLHRRLGATWTWSQAYRLGLAQGFGGQEVISSERFKAGGPDSLRGFATDSVGPKIVIPHEDAPPDVIFLGGNAVVILNQELRYRHRSGWGFALFWDLGNVFARVEDLSLDLRHDLGAGLRWASPVGMLRLDLAFPLDRKPEEDSYKLHFSLGQMF